MRKVFVMGGGRKAKKGTKNASKSRKIAVLEGERIFVGVDVHKRTYSVAVWSSERGLIATWTQPASPELLIEKLSGAAGNIVEIVYEAGPTGYGLVRALREAEFNANVIAPSETPRKAGRHSKCDTIDARKLGEYASGSEDLLRRIYVPTPQEEADRQVTRMREATRKKIQRTKCQVKAFLLTHGIEEPEGLACWARHAVDALHRLQLNTELRFALDVLLNDYDHFVAQMNRIDEKIEEMSKSERHAKAVKHMRTVGGVGLLTAMTHRTELPNPERFTRGDQITAAIGFVPFRHDSGDQEQHGGIEKTGNAHLRGALVESAWRWIAHDEHARAHYDRLVRNTGRGKKAIVGVARKLGILLWRLETRNDDYRPAA